MAVHEWALMLSRSSGPQARFAIVAVPTSALGRMTDETITYTGKNKANLQTKKSVAYALDEIGRMELHSEAFCAAMTAILDDGGAHIFRRGSPRRAQNRFCQGTRRRASAQLDPKQHLNK